MQFKKLTALFLCLVLVITAGAPLALPQLFGIPVFDAANLAEALVQSGHMVAELQRLLQMYNQMQAQYAHLQYQAKYLKNLGRYQTISTVWRQLQAQDWYNKNSPWVQAVNLGVGASNAWETLSRRPTRYPSLNSLSTVIQELRTDEVSTVQLADGMGINTIDLVGRVRAAGSSRETALSALEMDALSGDADMHTEAAQLNKIAALLTLLAKSQMDQNRLATNTLELQLLRTKLERDAMVNGLNQQTYAQAHTADFLTDKGPGPSDGLLNFVIQ